MQLPSPDKLVSPDARVAAAIQLHNALDGYIGTPPKVERLAPALFPDIVLPDASLPQARYLDAVSMRRSSYYSGGLAPELSDLAMILHALSKSPSAGGLGSCSCYLIVDQKNSSTGARDRNQLQNGCYVYQQRDGAESACLHAYREAASKSVAKCFLQPEFVSVFPVLVVLTCRTDVFFEKYSLKNYQMIFADAGILIQSMYLSCASLRLPCCAVGGIHAGSMQHMLGLEHSEIVTMCFAVGSIPPKQS